tara:strand:- start:959 stop:1201 length:243 start_codon:yes stop_codon:yes gene_type:complete
VLIEDRIIKILDLKDLTSMIHLDRWLKKNLSIYKDDAVIPKSDKIALLRYLEQKVLEQRITDKKDWLKAIEKLMEREERE